MQETFDKIIERVNFVNKDKLPRFLDQCIRESTDTSKSTYAIHENVLFMLDAFYIGLQKVMNDVPKSDRLRLGVETLMIIFEELGHEIEKEDAFILYHLRDQGKFRLKESKLRDQLKNAWGEHKEYRLEDQDLSKALKEMMRMGIIDYRKGSLTVKPNVIIRYKN